MVHAFEHKGTYIALDSYSGALHVLDRQAYKAVRQMAEGVPRREGTAALTKAAGPEEAAALMAEIDGLIADGQLFTEPPALTLPGNAGELKALCLHAAHDCDLRCAYCFAASGSFCGGRMLMPAEVGRAALDFLMERSGSRNTLEVDFFGGEPLLNYGMVKETVRYGRALEKQYGKRIRFTLTTNGTGLTDEVAEFLNEEMHNVVVSIDGRPEVHDALRKTRDGRGSHDKVLANAKRFVQERGDRSYYIRGTFTSRNLDFASDALYLFDKGFSSVSVEPAVLPADSPLALGPECLGRILDEYDHLADALMERTKRDEVSFFHFNVEFGGGPCIYKRLTGCGAGCEYMAVTPDGDLYPCHQFVGEEHFALGNVLTGRLDEMKRAPFRRNPADEVARCGNCWARPWCGGGCAANAWHQNGNVRKPYEMECEMEKKRIECAAYLYVMRNSQASE
jgi:uncharacterized protein